ncbi:tRNA pseudouridine synthase D [Microbulbifer aestuariivivens]|uniref:tRNA pseudouridine synthase D n=1 Tax=Microbulbifer aestuariivivens TaxID=1908308 RepID=A0ABP9WR28_9GAMM
MTASSTDPQWNLNWPCALGGAAIEADFRATPEDFVVEELAAPPADDGGEHVYLQVRKRAANTNWVAQQLARAAGVRPSDIGFYGLKDRHAVTTQWFSVWLGQKSAPDWSRLDTDEFVILKSYRGPRKLRRGEHVGNRFVITLRNVRGDRERATAILERLGQGVPNYFGEQRFGRDGGNLDLAMRIAGQSARVKRTERAFAMSAARSWLFNQVLAQRVTRHCWLQAMPGEPEAEPSGPLWGRGRNPATGELAELESSVTDQWTLICDWLEHCGLQQERRPLALRPEGYEFRWLEDDLELSFALPPGAFATAVLRELSVLVNESSANIE